MCCRSLGGHELSVALSLACAADPRTERVDEGVGLVEGVASEAFGLLRQNCDVTRSAQYVLLMRHRFEVSWVDAAPNSAQVVEFEAFGNRA